MVGRVFVLPVTATSHRLSKLISTVEDKIMLRWILIFLVVAIAAAVFGFTGIAGAATEIARTLFFIFLVLLVVSAIIHVFRGGSP